MLVKAASKHLAFLLLMLFNDTSRMLLFARPLGNSSLCMPFSDNLDFVDS